MSVVAGASVGVGVVVYIGIIVNEAISVIGCVTIGVDLSVIVAVKVGVVVGIVVGVIVGVIVANASAIGTAVGNVGIIVRPALSAGSHAVPQSRRLVALKLSLNFAPSGGPLEANG